jgi:excisionase family DNA binding protein
MATVDNPAITYSIGDAARAIGVSPRTVYNLAARGELQLIKVGSRSLIRHSDLVALIDRASKGGDAA